MKFEANPAWSKSDLVSRNSIFAAFALKDVLWITQEENIPPYFTFLGGKLVEISAISSAPKFPKFKTESTKIEIYSS